MVSEHSSSIHYKYRDGEWHTAEVIRRDCEAFVQLLCHLKEGGLVSGIVLQLQLLHASTCLISSLGEDGKTDHSVNDLAPGILSFYLNCCVTELA